MLASAEHVTSGLDELVHRPVTIHTTNALYYTLGWGLLRLAPIIESYFKPFASSKREK
jgi:hypothetical protein